MAYYVNDKGCIASKSIKGGTEIIREPTTFEEECLLSNGIKDSQIFWIMNVISSFHQMSKTDQNDYMKLYNKYNYFLKITEEPSQKRSDLVYQKTLQKRFEDRTSKILFLEQNEEEAMKILEILNICETNAFRGRVSKLSQFNPSSQPNATAECTGYDYFKDDFKIKALSKINAGEEITIARCYF